MNGYDEGFHPVPKLLVVIVDRSERERLKNILNEKHAHFQYMFHAMGTASSEILKAFGLSGTEKAVGICIEPSFRAKQLLSAVAERMELTRPGNGIVFILPVSGISAMILGEFSKGTEEREERRAEYMGQDTKNNHQGAKFEMVVAVVNQGFSEIVMDSAHTAGARGGTIINARKIGAEDSAKFFGISLQADKEIIAILIPKSQKKELMQAICKSCGMKTEAHGIVISLPVESCSGIDFGEDIGEQAE